MEYCTCSNKSEKGILYHNGLKTCWDCDKPYKAEICKVSNLKPKQIGYIHPASNSKETKSIIGQFFVLIDKKDNLYGILLNGERQIVNQEWAEDHYICESRKVMELEYIETDEYNPGDLEIGYGIRKYRNAYWDDEPSVNYPLADLDDGYVSLHTGGGWSCGAPYGAYISRDDGRVNRQISAILVCKTEHDAFNINYVVNKKDAQP